MGLIGYTEGGSERFWFDSVSAIVLFMTAIGGAWLPRYLCSPGAQVDSYQSLAFHLGNMLSAGVMLSAGFCHLLADAHRYLLFIGRFPMSNFLAATGYIITLLADQVVQYVSEATHDPSPSGSGKGASSGGGLSLSRLFRNGGYKPLSSSGAELTAFSSGGEKGDATVLTGQEGLLTTVVHRDGAGHGHANGHDPEREGSGGGAAATATINGGGDGHDDSKSGSGSQLPGSPSLNRSHGGLGAGPSADCHSGVAVLLGGGRKLSFATAVLLASALCIHSILEGMALGAQVSMRSTEDIMVAIAAHKGLAAYALGASIMESGASANRFWTVIGCFSMATPIGIFAGYIMSSAASSKSGAALSALASGTFLYVAFMEVIPKELADGKHRAAKMAAFLLGYALMSLLAVWA